MPRSIIISKGKIGELGSNSKLSNEDVRKIKDRIFNGETSYSISRELGLSKATIHYIEVGKTWAHIEGPVGPRRESESGKFEPGSKPHNTKLTDEQIREIRSRYEVRGETLDAIAKDYGITGGNVSMIGRRKTWKHVK